MEKNHDTKKEPNYRGVKAMPFVIGNETFEKLGTLGTSSNLLVYLSTVFNINSITATNIINIFNGTCNLGTLVGAFLSDTYLGRYKVLGIASISSFLGMLMLTMTAAFPSLHPRSCGSHDDKRSCGHGPSTGQTMFLYSAFAFLIIGASGIRPCNLAFGADQFNPNTESGKRGITSFFNWYYFTFTFAMMVSLTIIVYVQASINWAIGLGIPAFLMFLSCVFFFVGTRIYVKVPPQGSPLTSIVQTLVVAFKKRKLELPKEPWCSLFNHIPSDTINSKLAYTDEFQFLNKAAIVTPENEINQDGSAMNPWALRSVQQVEEIKCILRCVPIWIAMIMYFVLPTQMFTYVTFQSIQTDRSIGSGSFKIPAASYTVFSMMSLTLWIPIYDRIVVPTLRRFTGRDEGITILQRIGVGLIMGVITMISAGLVESHRRHIALTHPTLGFVERKGAISAMSGYWLVVPQALAGMSEAFAAIGQIEFYYKQFPENMRSFAGSFTFCSFAVSSYISSFLVSVVHRATKARDGSNWLADDLNKGRLEYFYYLVAGIQVVNLGYFLVCAKWYKYKKIDEDNDGTNKEVGMEEFDQPKHHVV